MPGRCRSGALRRSSQPSFTAVGISCRTDIRRQTRQRTAMVTRRNQLALDCLGSRGQTRGPAERWRPSGFCADCGRVRGTLCSEHSVRSCAGYYRCFGRRQLCRHPHHSSSSCLSRGFYHGPTAERRSPGAGLVRAGTLSWHAGFLHGSDHSRVVEPAIDSRGQIARNADRYRATLYLERPASHSLPAKGCRQ